VATAVKHEQQSSWLIEELLGCCKHLGPGIYRPQPTSPDGKGAAKADEVPGTGGTRSHFRSRPQQLSPSNPSHHACCVRLAAVLLDAANVDVYKGAQCVVFMYDPRKKWTFDYVQRSLEKLSEDLPVLILVRQRPCGQNILSTGN